jgi:hypothetical protein
MLTFANVYGRNCHENAGPSKLGRSDLWDSNTDFSLDDIGMKLKIITKPRMTMKILIRRAMNILLCVSMPSISRSLSLHSGFNPAMLEVIDKAAKKWADDCRTTRQMFTFPSATRES